MENKNCSISVIVSVATLFFLFTGSITIPTLIIAVLASVLSLFLAIKGKEEAEESEQAGKSFAITAIVIATIILFIIGFNILSLFKPSNKEEEYNVCTNVNEIRSCIEIENGKSNCKFRQDEDVVCNTSDLKDEQFKKNE